MPQKANRPARIDVRYPARIVTARGGEQDVLVTDVSANGFRLVGHTALKAGDQLYVKIGKTDSVSCEVRWTQGAEAGGVIFSAPGLPRPS